MKHDQSSKNRFRSLCAEIGDDDGLAQPLHASRKASARRAGSRHTAEPGEGDRKAWQLSRQVAHTLDEVLAECGDTVLQGLRVEGVEPFPDASRLLVTVGFIDERPGMLDELGEVVDHLQHASGHLRAEVATAVTRKRAPLLVYRLAGPAGKET